MANNCQSCRCNGLCNHPCCNPNHSQCNESIRKTEAELESMRRDRDATARERNDIEELLIKAEAERDALRPSDVRPDEVSFAVFALRQIRAGNSYDAETGIWWNKDSKPGIVKSLESELAETRRRLENEHDEVAFQRDRVEKAEADLAACIKSADIRDEIALQLKAELDRLKSPNGIVQLGETMRGYIETYHETPLSTYTRLVEAEDKIRSLAEDASKTQQLEVEVGRLTFKLAKVRSYLERTGNATAALNDILNESGGRCVCPPTPEPTDENCPIHGGDD